MIVTKPDGSKEDVPLYDFGTGSGDGVPVVWTDGVGVCQDPNYGSNCYGPGAVLTDDNGHWYQIGTDWAIRPMGSAGPSAATNPTTQQQSGSTTKTVSGTATATGTGTGTTKGPNQLPNPGTPVQVTGNFGTWLNQTHLVLGVPVAGTTLAMAGAGGVALLMLKRRRR